MMELYQTEWCPASRRVRQRFTELGLAYVIRQVPVDKADRRELLAATGSDVVPALVLEDETRLIGEGAIRAFLDGHVPEPAGAEAHRAKAEKARRRELEQSAAALPDLNSLPAVPLEVPR